MPDSQAEREAAVNASQWREGTDGHYCHECFQSPKRGHLEWCFVPKIIAAARAAGRGEAAERIEALEKTLGATAEDLHDGGASYYHGGGPIRSCADLTCKIACALLSSEGAEGG